MATVRVCRDCGLGMISRSQYQQNAVLGTKYVAAAAHGMCAGCYNTARHYTRKPDQPADRRYQRRIPVGQPCRGCGRPMMPSSKYYATSARRTTHVPLGGHGMCQACYVLARRQHTLPNPVPGKRPRRYRTRANGATAPTRLHRSLDPVTLAALRGAVGITPAQAAALDDPPAERHEVGEVVP